MKFNKYISPEIKELLEKQYKEYISKTSMTRKEQRALREWVKDGHSVYENASGAWYDGQAPVEFLTIYREEEYIRQQTKGMSPEEARKYAMAYYGWDDEVSNESDEKSSNSSPIKTTIANDEDLPFN